MKKILAFLILAVIVSSCQKVKTCKRDYYFLSFSLGFKGFTETDLNKLVLKKYKVGSDFTELIGIDSVINPHLELADDGVYLRELSANYKLGFFELYENEYILEMPSAQRTFKISNVDAGERSFTYKAGRHEECSGGGTNLKGYVSCDIDGVKTSTVSKTSNHYYVVIEQ